MVKETSEVELKRLRAVQSRTMQEQVFGGLSPDERTAFDARRTRISQLEKQLIPSIVGKGSSRSAKGIISLR
jgi:hypothetical protein